MEGMESGLLEDDDYNLLERDDFYEIFEDSLDDDQISAEEAGFMTGFVKG